LNVWILTKERINVLQKEELVHKTWAWTNMGHWLMRTTKYFHMAFFILGWVLPGTYNCFFSVVREYVPVQNIWWRFLQFINAQTSSFLYEWLTLLGFSPISLLCAQLHEYPETDHCQKLSPSTPLMWNAAFIWWIKFLMHCGRKWTRYSRTRQIRRFLIVSKYINSLLFY